MLKFKVIVLLFLIFPANSSHAQDLGDILNSSELKDYDKEAKSNSNLQNDLWLKKGENFSKIFTDRDGPKHLHLWLDTSTRVFKLKKNIFKSTTQFSYLVKEYLSPRGKDLVVRVLVPHPRYEEMAKNMLIKEFAELQPPQLKVSSREELEIHNLPATHFVLFSRNHALLFRLDKSTLVHILGGPDSYEDLFELARQLSVKRLNQKLGS